MKEAHRQRLEQRLLLARELGPAMVQRGVLQRFFVSPVLPMEPLAPREIAAAWQRLALEIRADRAPELLSLYVHIPFCAHRCRYCVYYSVEPANGDQVEAYLRRLHAEIDFYADSLSGVGISNCYLGGGTPTLLDEAQLRALLTHLDRAFTRKRGGEWSFECNPATVTEAKAELFRAHGFNRVSFGVQSLNPRVLDGVGRGYQTRSQVVETFRIMRQRKFWINVDLMHGLPGQTSASLLESLASLLALEPTQVTIYALSPYTPMELEPGGREPLASLAEKVNELGHPLGFFSYAGSTFVAVSRDDGRNPDDRARLPPEAEDLMTAEHLLHGGGHNYDDTTVEPFSLLGLGPTARSYVYGQMRYMNDRVPVDADWTPDLTSATGRTVDMDEERRRYVVDGLERLGGVQPGAYEERFGEPLADRFGEELLFGVEQGLLEQAQGRVRIKPQEPEARYATALLFVDDATVQIALDAADNPDGDEAERDGGEAGDGDAEPTADDRPGETSDDEEFALALRAHGQEVVVHLADHWPGRQSYHRTGPFAFYLPSSQPEGTCDTGNQHARVLATFTRLFQRVVTRESPTDLRDLHRRLLARFGG